jgi:hypothetical protein
MLDLSYNRIGDKSIPLIANLLFSEKSFRRKMRFISKKDGYASFSNEGIEKIKQVWDTAGKKPGGLIMF